jgi:restriction system protein
VKANQLIRNWAEEELAMRLTARCHEVAEELRTVLFAGLSPALEGRPSPELPAGALTESLSGSRLPGYLSIRRTAEVDARSKSVVVDVHLPRPSDVPAVVEYRFAKKADKVQPVTMKPRQHDELYDSVVKQLVLRTLHEVFQASTTEQVEAAVVNGWVAGTDSATGHATRTCVVSVSATRDQFAGLKLEQVDPSACVRNLKGLVAGPLAQLAPVQPIMQFNRADRRFVDGRDVLNDLNSAANLAEMPWEDFEQLVRELFGKVFATDGAEVRITQASRDGGVDAIAFDPDPIRGGKFVIQAKRYTKVVPVSAVRDLYGTMINEGAAKGILVTTAYFGPDTRDFAKDKPITLIDGPNLAFLLEKHGYKVRIDLAEAREHQKSRPT